MICACAQASCACGRVGCAKFMNQTSDCVGLSLFAAGHSTLLLKTKKSRTRLSTGVAVPVLRRSQFSGLRLIRYENNTKRHTNTSSALGLYICYGYRLILEMNKDTVPIKFKTLLFNLKCQMASCIARLIVNLAILDCVLTHEYNLAPEW